MKLAQVLALKFDVEGPEKSQVFFFQVRRRYMLFVPGDVAVNFWQMTLYISSSIAILQNLGALQ
jgi:hypothetical protein